MSEEIKHAVSTSLNFLLVQPKWRKNEKQGKNSAHSSKTSLLIMLPNPKQGHSAARMAKNSVLDTSSVPQVSYQQSPNKEGGSVRA